jgi:hypothetical protein
LGQDEVLPEFQALSQLVLDDSAITERNRQEKLKEKQVRTKVIPTAAAVTAAPPFGGAQTSGGIHTKKHR